MAKMFYSLDEAASRLGKTASAVRAMIESGELQEFRSGDELVVKREQIDLLVGDDGNDESVHSEILGSGESSMMSQLNDDSLGVIGLSDSVVDDDAPIIGDDPDDSLVIGLEDSAAGAIPTDDSVAGGSIGLSESVADNINLDGGTNVGSSTGEPLTGDGSGIISLASESGSHAAIDFDVPESIDNKDQTGISIFDDSLEDGDDAAATIVTDATEADLSTPDFDAGASGSGLLDLTREGDDTSLGVDLLDDGSGASGAGLSGVGEISEEGALFETPDAADTDIAQTVPMAAFQEAYDGGGSGLVGGLALGVVLSMLFTGAITVLWLMGGSGAQLFEQFGAIPWFGPAAAIAALTLLVTIIAWVLGRKS